jgi:3-oxoacyl-[acyl-carrier protein] reductase
MFTESIKNKNVLVTGGSKGIGKGIADVFCKAGANVMIAARNEDDAKATATQLNCHYVIGDVGNWDDVQRIIQTTVDKLGSLDILCANAGYFPQTKIVDMDPSEWDDVMNTNLKSSFLCVKAAIPQFEKANKGRVILTSSITGPITGYPGWSHYGASKAGQLGFLRTAAMELSKYNTTINAVLPGNIITEGLKDMGEDYLNGMAASIPLKRLGSVEDIGYAVLFFASDNASYITGQQIVIDGGQIIPESQESIAEI